MTNSNAVQATPLGNKRTPLWQRVAIALAILLALVVGGACFVGGMVYMSQHAYNRHLDRGNAHWNAGEYEAALDEFAVQLEMYPDDWRAYVNRAGVYLHMGEYNRAIGEAGKAIELNPGARNAYLNRAAANTSKGEYLEAVADANKVIVLSPTEPGGYYWRGLAYAALGRPREANADLESYLSYVETDERDSLAQGAIEELEWLKSRIGDPDTAADLDEVIGILRSRLGQGQ